MKIKVLSTQHQLQKQYTVKVTWIEVSFSENKRQTTLKIYKINQNNFTFIQFALNQFDKPSNL